MPMSLTDYLALDYPLRLTPDPDGGYIFEYPDLPGCMGQIDTLDELPEHAAEARTLWLEVAYERGKDIPLPSQAEEYSGKFIVRIAKSLHRALAEAANEEGVSLNAFVSTLLAAGQVWYRADQRFEDVGARIESHRPSIRPSARHSATNSKRTATG